MYGSLLTELLREISRSQESYLSEQPSQPKKEDTPEVSELLKTAEQYEEQAKALREEAQKKRESLRKLKYSPAHSSEVTAITTNGHTEYFVRENDAQNYLLFLKENDIKNPEVKKISVTLVANFWRE